MLCSTRRCVVFCVAAGLFAGAAWAADKKPQTFMGWGTAVDPDGDCRFAAGDGKLTMTVPKTYHDLTYVDGKAVLNAPRVMTEVSGDFEVQVKVPTYVLPEDGTSSSGKYSFVSAGLLIWQDQKNFIRFERSCLGSSTPFWFVGRIIDGQDVSRPSGPTGDVATLLRVERTGRKLTYSMRVEGDPDWKEVHSEDLDFAAKLQVGVEAVNTTTREFQAKFESLELKAKQ